MPRPTLALLALLLTPVAADPLRLLVVGDSLSDEYGAASTLQFSVPDQPSSNPRATNWTELLETRRSTEAGFGSFENWDDLRSYGYIYRSYERNFGIVGTTSLDWLTILGLSSASTTIPFPFNLQIPSTRSSLVDRIPETDVVVIFLGGNDLKNIYSPLFNDTEPAGFLDGILANLDAIHGYFRARTTAPIVVATVPDVGATPDIFGTYNVPAQQVSTRAKIAALNADIIATFEARQDTAVARIDRLIDEVFEVVFGGPPFDLNGTEFELLPTPQMPPDHLFCKDGFHPHSVSQALVANEIIAAINQLTADPTNPEPITPFANREILASILGFDPDQPFLDYLVANGLPPSTDPESDGDRDGLPALVEMGLGTDPDAFSSPFGGAWRPGAHLTWSTSADALRYLELVPEESLALADWDPVPDDRRDGESVTPPPGADAHYLRFRATPRP